MEQRGTYVVDCVVCNGDAGDSLSGRIMDEMAGLVSKVLLRFGV